MLWCSFVVGLSAWSVQLIIDLCLALAHVTLVKAPIFAMLQRAASIMAVDPTSDEALLSRLGVEGAGLLWTRDASFLTSAEGTTLGAPLRATTATRFGSEAGPVAFEEDNDAPFVSFSAEQPCEWTTLSFGAMCQLSRVVLEMGPRSFSFHVAVFLENSDGDVSTLLFEANCGASDMATTFTLEGVGSSPTKHLHILLQTRGARSVVCQNIYETPPDGVSFVKMTKTPEGTILMTPIQKSIPSQSKMTPSPGLKLKAVGDNICSE